MIFKKNKSSKEQVKNLVEMLDKNPAHLLGISLAIETLTEKMVKEIPDKKFDALIDLLSQLEFSAQKQFELIKGIKIILDMPTDTN